jgi:hypothetical protein
MGWIVGDEVRQPFVACLVVSSVLLGHVLASVGRVVRTR